MKSIGILGSTGSIGTQALEIIKNSNQNFLVDYLYSNSNYKILYEQILDFSPNYVCINDKESYMMLSDLINANHNIKTQVIFGVEDSLDFISDRNVDLALNAIVGVDGLKPTMHITSIFLFFAYLQISIIFFDVPEQLNIIIQSPLS